MLDLGRMVALVLVGGLAIGFGVGTAFGPVARVRVELFAQRQRLLITPANGDQVIRYLATTRRWRVAGLVAAVIICTAWTLRRDSIGLDSLTMFAGWFGGALIAEARVAHLARGPRRAASLAPRLPSAYVSRTSWKLLPATVAISTVVAAISLVEEQRTGRVTWPAAAYFGATLAIAVAVRLTQARVLHRPQPLADDDVIAADDAIRSRSLHVLAGGGAALILYCVLGQLAALNLPTIDPAGAVATAAIGLSTFLVPILGYVLATRAWQVDRRAAAW